MTSLWLQHQPAPRCPQPLPSRTEVAIVGGGIAGVATALHLSERGVGVTVLERETVAARASGRNDGQLLLGLGEHYHRIHGQFGTERATQLWSFLAANHAATLAAVQAHGIECDLQCEGGLRLAETAHEFTELQTAAALLAMQGRDHELLPRAALCERFAAAQDFHGALYLPGEAIVHPAKLVRGLAAAAERAGAHIVAAAEVSLVSGEAGEFLLTLRDGRSVQANAVVHCTSTLSRQLDATGLLQRTVFPFRGQIIATDELPSACQAQFPPWAMSSNFCYEYFRMHRGRLLLGGQRWSVKGEEVGLLDDQSVNPAITQNLRAYALRHFPSLGDIAFPHVWTGIMAGTPDGLPLLGAIPGQPGTYALLAFNGYGLSFAFLAAKCLAELLTDGHCEEPVAAWLQPRRFG